MDSSEKVSARGRLLEVIHILSKYTDDKEMLTVHEIHGYFPENLKVGIGAIRDDLLFLEKSPIFPVFADQAKNGLVKKYYYAGRLFEVFELRLLMDAISAAKFISKTESEHLHLKIKELTSQRLAKQLKNELAVADEYRHSLEDISSVVQLLHESVEECRVVSFQYGRFGTDLQFQLSKNGDEYQVKPYGLVWNNDKYYFVGNYIVEDEVRQYRVDRMRNVRVLEESFVVEPHFNLTTYLSKMFHMFSGDKISLEVEFNNSLLNAIIDRFGTGANIKESGHGTINLKTQADMSEGLVRWLLRWGSDAKVLHPAPLIARMKEEAEKLYRLYE